MHIREIRQESLLSCGENERTIHIEVKFTKILIPAYNVDELEKAYAYVKRTLKSELIGMNVKLEQECVGLEHTGEGIMECSKKD